MIKLSNLNKSIIGGGITLLIAFNLYNALNFFFHFAMARLLSISDYGILASLYSIIYVFGIFSEPIQTIIAKYTSVEKNHGKLKNILRRSLKKGFRISLIIFAVYLLISIPLALLLKMPYLLVSSTGIIIFASFLMPVTRGIMQGRKSFKALGFNMLIEAISKLSLAILLVLLGWKVFGAMAATILSVAISFAFSFLAFRDLKNAKEKIMPTPDIYSYAKKTFFVLLSVLVFFSADVIIAGMVFDRQTAGIYSIASVLSKTIFLGTQPISKAMFPIASESAHKATKKQQKNILLSAMAMLLACLFVALLAVYFFPDLLVRIFSGRYIPESASILFYTALAFSILSITNLLLIYRLSTGAARNSLFLLVFVFIQALLLVYFSASLLQFSIAFIAASAIFLLGSILLLDK
jgi:O-antigen/teichoic acid export membrane protein